MSGSVKNVRLIEIEAKSQLHRCFVAIISYPIYLEEVFLFHPQRSTLKDFKIDRTIVLEIDAVPEV